MSNYIYNLFKLPGLYLAFYRNLNFQQAFIRKLLLPDIQAARKVNDGSLDEKDFRKITNYYALGVPAILGEAFCSLRGKRMSEDERLALTWFGAATGLFDDFFDKRKMSEDHIRRLLSKPEEIIAESSFERLSLDFYLKALAHTADAGLLKRVLLQVFEAQILSKRQVDPAIETDEIRHITFLKGGVSILLYRSVFGECTNEEEKLMLMKTGGLGQLENDMFDVYKDSRDGIRTLATTEKNISNLRKTYTTLTKEVAGLVHNTAYPHKNKQKFLGILSLVVSKGFVCLDKLEKIERKTNNTFTPENYRREDLICDMEKPLNIFRSVHYYAKCDLK
ncbi:MAG: class 1 isoprenoid biosynthesis enzyme [Lentimicrobium sp.]|nr:class 1 isoprenoid biosynthesis enzyme [Lentimicrobium sp.]